jgi:hypothetical protein
MLAEAEKHGGGNYSLEHIKLYVNTGQWMLLVATDNENKIHGSAVMSFINYPASRIGFVTCSGGKGVFNKHVVSQLVSIAASKGATKVQATARDSVVRLLESAGFSKRSTVVEINMQEAL